MKHIVLSTDSQAVMNEISNLTMESNGKEYMFMPYIFEKTADPNKFIVHELPESIVKAMANFIKS